ncbi:MAG: metal-dependent hydrolase [Verrucomicrobia bacterium]|nr:MAG: metal-dependent hydrolase [Verrucomicrobiota bacterium]
MERLDASGSASARALWTGLLREVPGYALGQPLVLQPVLCLAGRVQLEWAFGPGQRTADSERFVRVAGRQVRVRFVRHQRARRYVLRLGADGAARVTIPQGGSAAEAGRFAERNVRWLERQLLRQATHAVRSRTWSAGVEILFRGEPVRLELTGKNGVVRFGDEVVRLADTTGDLRPAIERHLWRLAAREFPARVFELAALHRLPVRRVTVRNQRSRWGSCSRRGTISLNWRLVQAPPFVRDYLVLHELAHLKEMNHSRRFWREVARLCPEFPAAERWLKQHSGLLS